MRMIPRRITLAVVIVLGSSFLSPVCAFKASTIWIRDAATSMATSLLAPLLLASSPIVGQHAHAADYSNFHPSQSNAPTSEIRRTSSTTISATENYLPRRLYPGTYKNYCGPTPETQVRGGCIAHGWHGDAPADVVDGACRVHDLSYCQCETQLLSRQRVSKSKRIGGDGVEEKGGIPNLSSLVALRFATKAVLERTADVDGQYFECVNRADRNLIATGVKIRAEQQRAGCSADPNLSWFCDVNNQRGPLATFERINMNIFVWDLDFDEAPLDRPFFVPRWRAGRGGSDDRETLAQLERRRKENLRKEIQRGSDVAGAASSKEVVMDEERILRKLAIEGNFD